MRIIYFNDFAYTNIKQFTRTLRQKNWVQSSLGDIARNAIKNDLIFFLSQHSSTASKNPLVLRIKKGTQDFYYPFCVI